MERITKIKNNKGFALLYAVVISSIILAISLSVSDIALKEIIFSTSAKDSNDAFYATDTATECALFYDSFDPAKNVFIGTSGMICGGNPIIVSKPTSSLSIWQFVVSNLGSSGKACAEVMVDKENYAPLTKITSVGYNNGGAVPGICVPALNSTQRVIELNY